MKKTIAIITMAVVAGGSNLSAVISPMLDVRVTSDLTFASEYAFRGLEYADNSFQPSLEAAVGDFYVGIFANLPIDRGDKNDQSEIHYYGGRSVVIPGLEGIVLDVGATVYHWPDSNLNRTHEAFIGTKFEDVWLSGIGVGAYYFYDFDRRAHAIEGSAGYSFALDQMGQATIDISAFVGNQFGGNIRGGSPRINENYHYYGGAVELPFRLNDFSTVTAGAHYQSADRGSFGAMRNQNFFWTVSYTAGF